MTVKVILTVTQTATLTAAMLHYLKEILGAAPSFIPALPETPAVVTSTAMATWMDPMRRCLSRISGGVNLTIPARAAQEIRGVPTEKRCGM